MLQRFLWKLLPKPQRTFLLGRLSVVDRQVVNKSLSANVRFPELFSRHSSLFIHVPKCAGSSICAALYDGWMPGHLPLYWYEQQFPEQYAASFKFAFVRDPLERAYSAYAFLRGNAVNNRDKTAHQLVSGYRDFDDFISRWLHADNVDRQLHFAPQWKFLVDSMGSLAMDFIGHQEHLDEDFKTLAERFGVDSALARVNVTRQRQAQPVAEFCSTRTRRLVRRVYARDYEMLGYE